MQRHVNLGTPSDPLAIRAQDRMVYLGVVVSYHQFELRTLQHRMKVANTQKHRLVKVLHSARAISLKHRIRDYLACIRSTTMYGLHAVGITPRVAARLSSFEIRHLRALARSPAHITRESNKQLLERLGVTSSLVYLSKLLEKRIERVDCLSIRKTLDELALAIRQLLFGSWRMLSVCSRMNVSSHLLSISANFWPSHRSQRAS